MNSNLVSYLIPAVVLALVSLVWLRRKRSGRSDPCATSVASSPCPSVQVQSSRAGLAVRLRCSCPGWPTRVIEGEFGSDDFLHFTILVVGTCQTALSSYGRLFREESDLFYREVFQTDPPQDHLSQALTHGQSSLEIWREKELHRAVTDDTRESHWKRVLEAFRSTGLLSQAEVLERRFPRGPMWQ